MGKRKSKAADQESAALNAQVTYSRFEISQWSERDFRMHFNATIKELDDSLSNWRKLKQQEEKEYIKSLIKDKLRSCCLYDRKRLTDSFKTFYNDAKINQLGDINYNPVVDQSKQIIEEIINNTKIKIKNPALRTGWWVSDTLRAWGLKKYATVSLQYALNQVTENIISGKQDIEPGAYKERLEWLNGKEAETFLDRGHSVKVVIPTTDSFFNTVFEDPGAMMGRVIESFYQKGRTEIMNNISQYVPQNLITNLNNLQREYYIRKLNSKRPPNLTPLSHDFLEGKILERYNRVQSGMEEFAKAYPGKIIIKNPDPRVQQLVRQIKYSGIMPKRRPIKTKKTEELHHGITHTAKMRRSS